MGVAMRFLCILLLISAVTCALQAQVPDNSPEADVRDALNLKSDFYGSGIMDKRFSRRGDSAAVAITKVVAGQRLDAATIDRLLTIIRMAFSSPHIIDVVSHTSR